MSLEPLGFMVFSTIETFAWYYLSMSLFRYKPNEYTWQALFIILLMNLQSFVLRNEYDLSYMVPVISILLFTFFYRTVVKIPLIGAFSLTIAGFLIFGIVQTALLIAIFGSIAEAMRIPINGYIGQFSTGVVVIGISHFIYKLRFGFTFDFEKVRLKSEDIVLLALMFIFLIAITVILFLNEIWLNIIFFTVALSFLLFYAVIKEKDEFD
ncbi:hypothetical protein J2Z69_000512 [Paenibacillus shirakamiensis]|uniref:Uncharacterized protein n=1 Tax=Paenibacillus shirakamiensis TaxID=1265935 RepID=A0ABS4JCR4_9BACL|nr:hypothetical protein [Paenibacillus shirakamiensis]MBP1999493.1 hypothetical protein [Paenibacillus shirakamiensis]